MTRRTRVDHGANVAESKFYLPAGSTRSFVAEQLERVWAALFNHGVEVKT
jgi:hypothetical protein